MVGGDMIRYEAVMYDVQDGVEVGQIYLEDNKPEKVYKDRCDNYGDLRDFYRQLSNLDVCHVCNEGVLINTFEYVSIDNIPHTRVRSYYAVCTNCKTEQVNDRLGLVNKNLYLKAKSEKI